MVSVHGTGGTLHYYMSPPSRVRNSHCEAYTVKTTNLQDPVQIHCEAEGGRADQQHLQHDVHTFQGLQEGQIFVLSGFQWSFTALKECAKLPLVLGLHSTVLGVCRGSLCE